MLAALGCLLALALLTPPRADALEAARSSRSPLETLSVPSTPTLPVVPTQPQVLTVPPVPAVLESGSPPATSIPAVPAPAPARPEHAALTPSQAPAGGSSEVKRRGQDPRADSPPARTRPLAKVRNEASRPPRASRAASSPPARRVGAAEPRQDQGPDGSLARAAPARRPTPPSAGPPNGAAPLRRAVDAIDAIPLPLPAEVKALLLALALLALALGAHSLLIAGRARRLEREQAALLEDVGLLQQALLPVVPERIGALRASVAYRPASGPAAGGDFYDVFALAGGRVGIIVGDVSGHGREALRRTTVVHYAVRAYLEAGLEPCAALQTAGRVLDGDDVEPTTVVAAVHDPGDGSLTYACAGHPPPVLVGVPAHEPVTAASSPPLAAGAPTGRRQTAVTLSAGSMACFFTDGLMEVRLGPDRLGFDRLAAMVTELSARDGAGALLDRITACACEVADDMAACIVRAEHGAGPSVDRIEQLEVDTVGARRPVVGAFLAQCGLDEGDRAAALRRACATADEFGGALIRVLVGDGPPTVEVDPPRASPLNAPAPRPATTR